MANKYIVDLTAAEQEELCHLIKQGKGSCACTLRINITGSLTARLKDKKV